MSVTHFNVEGYSDLLAKWVVFSQKHLYRCPERPGLICYGAGEHGHWGVHTHQKALSAFAVAATSKYIDWKRYGLERAQVRKQALEMLRYTLDTHLTGNFVCTNGEKWGHNWIYTLGIERMFHGIEALDEYLTDEDRSKLRAMMLSECDFLLEEYPIRAGLITGNKPESNIWNGATLYRGAVLYPDAPNAERYLEKAKKFFANGLSLESDENSDEIVDGSRVGDLFVGANLYNSYANNHHGYMNVGYMVICLSNIAMLHFFYKARGLKPDAMVYHHLKEQWNLIRSLTFEDGRLLRIGGDSRARYCYCQDYLLPAWTLIEDVFDEDCSGLEQGWFEILRKETNANGDGSFLSNRFGRFEEQSPVYYTRLESDRANVISMALYWHDKYGIEGHKKSTLKTQWEDNYHGSAFSGVGNRYASFTWRASELPQGLLLPKDDSSLAEWRYNLAGRIEGVGRTNEDIVETHNHALFDGGFITCGNTISRSGDFLAEGQRPEDMARKHVAFAALPDEASVLCLQYAKALNRTYLKELRGIFWNIPNDIFNGRQRMIMHENGVDYLRGGDYAVKYETIALGNCVNVDNKVGMASAQPLTLVRAGRRQVEIKGRLDSGTLYAEEVCAPYITKRRWYDRGQTMIDIGFAMTLGNWEDTRALKNSLFTPELPELKAVGVVGKDGHKYLLIANFSDEQQTLDPAALNLGKLIDVASGKPAGEIVLEQDQAILLRTE